MKSNKALTEEQKKQDVDLWIIALVTGAVYVVFATVGSHLQCAGDDR